MNKYQKALDNHNEMLDMIEGINEMQGKKVKFDRSGLLLLQKLVDKETPKKIITKHKKDRFGDTWSYKTCPSCRNELPINYKENYCYECGQKIDWEESEE